MKCSDEWLRSWVNVSQSLPELAAELTMLGLEADAIENDVLSLDITPNRGDCFSVLGIAREVAAFHQCSMAAPDYAAVTPTHDTVVPVKLEAPDACPRYLCRVIKDIRRDATTPAWLSRRLAESDIRAIHPVVDILNYVMCDLGQPMHAFDLAKIADSIVVRYAKPQESLALLDEQTITFNKECLVIADAKKALAFAGIMGGEDSGVTENTQDVVLESALFMPEKIAGKGRQYGLHTDSQIRFERGVDPELPAVALERATALILEICGGEPGPVNEAMDTTQFPAKKTILLSYGEITALIGKVFSPEQVENLLSRVGCVLTPDSLHDTTSPTWRVAVPTYRWDITQSVDLVEEVARMGGYDNIPAEMPQMTALFAPLPENQITPSRFKRMWVDLGYQEVITYSFVDKALQQSFFPQEEAVTLMNPISQELGEMRLSLWPSLITVLQFNQNRQQSAMRIFEMGSSYHHATKGFEERRWLSGLLCGPLFPNTWRQKASMSDFFTAKQHLEQVWVTLGYKTPLRFEPDTTLSCCHPGQCAKIFWQDKPVGTLGRLHPQLEKSLDVMGPVILFELKAEAWLRCETTQQQSQSRFPEIRRDIAIVVDGKIPAGKILEFVRESASECLKQVSLFDVYEDKVQLQDRKSLALGLILQHSSRTLIDQEADDIVKALLHGLKKEFNATLRE